MIYIGQELAIPLPKSRIPLGEFDLNCDQTPERVQLIPNPNDPSLETVFGVVIETMSGIGLFKETWQYTIADKNAKLIAKPQIFNHGSCRQLLAIYTLSQPRDTPEYQYFRMEDEVMKVVQNLEAIWEMPW